MSSAFCASRVRLVLIASSACVLAPHLDAAVIHVPADQPTIQQAIDAARDGDGILVASGTYAEIIDFKGKAITVASETGPLTTIIDAQRTGSVVTFASGEGVASVIQGFTLQNGSGTWHDDPWSHESFVGGGVFCLGSSPVIRGNVIGGYATIGGAIYCGAGAAPLIRDNVIDGDADGLGGGVYASDSSPVIDRNDFPGCRVNSFGGAIYAMRSTLLITSNSIRNSGAAEGGGLFARESTLTVTDNVFDANWTDEQEAGAISLSSCTTLIEGNRFTANSGWPPCCIEVEDSTSVIRIIGNSFLDNWQSGIIRATGDVLIEKNVFARNVSHGFYSAVVQTLGTGPRVVRKNRIEGGSIGISSGGLVSDNLITGAAIGIEVESPSPDTLISGNRITLAADTGIHCFSWDLPAQGTIAGNVILDCEHGIGLAKVSTTVRGNLIARCSNHGIGIASGAPTLIDNTITQNAAADAGGGILIEDAAATIAGNVVWGNTAPASPQIFVASGAAVVSYSDVEGGWPGTGNIDADPRFVDPIGDDWRVAPGSPCIDAGDPLDRTGATDLFGSPRLLDGDLDGVRVIDIGCAEFDHVQLATSRARPDRGSPRESSRLFSLERDAMLVIDTRGSSGLDVIMFAGAMPGDVDLGRYGPLFLDLSSPFLLIPWGKIPSRVEIAIPADAPFPVHFVLQELAFDPRAQAGNTSNPVELVID